MAKKVRVLVVDDSAVVRQTLTTILESDPDIQVIGSAVDPYAAAQKIKQEVPDVMTLDIEMPRMDGLTFLRKIMSQHPIPIVICSTLTEKGNEATLKALEYGAVEIITKPKVGTKKFFEEAKIRICDAVKAAGRARLTKMRRPAAPMKIQPKLTADAVLPAGRPAPLTTTEKVIVLVRVLVVLKLFVFFLKHFLLIVRALLLFSICRRISPGLSLTG